MAKVKHRQDVRALRKPVKTGHCANPQSANPKESHKRCKNSCGAGYFHPPTQEFNPCPCSCHLKAEYECGGCGRPIREAPFWPNVEEPGEMVYVHVDVKTGDAIGPNCA